jgi:hypothetical protein
MIYIEFADIIGIAIITYASILTKNNFHLRRDIRLGFHVSGMALAILYCLDLLW